MAEEEGKKEEEFRLTPEGEAAEWITLEQARVLAIEHARDNIAFYGRRYRGINLVWEVDSQEAGEDYYDIKLSFRPAGSYSGQPGVEQFIMEKTGAIRVRQILGEPSDLPQPPRRGPPLLMLAAVGLLIVAAVGIGAVFALGGNGPPPDATPFPAAVIAPTSTPSPTTTPLPTPTTVPLVVLATEAPTATLISRPPVSPTPVPPTPTTVPPTPTAVTPTPALQAQVRCPQAGAPHQFFGSATVADGSLAPDDMVVAALIGGSEAAMITVESGFQAGRYVLDVTPLIGETYVGKMVTFTVDGMAVGGANWQTRVTQGLNMTAFGVLSRQGVVPHQFFGTATLADGCLAPDGTVVAALIGGVVVVTTTVESRLQAGFYLLDVPQPTGDATTVTFTVGGVATGDRVSWMSRESQELNLTAGSPTPTPTPKPTPRAQVRCPQAQAATGFYGTATLADGSVASDDTAAAALVGGVEGFTTTVERGFQPGFYLLGVTPPLRETYVGHMVAYTEYGMAAAVSAGWQTRMTPGLNMTASGVLSRQDVPSHRFFGTATLADGSVAPDGTVVAALIGGVVVATATVESSVQAGFYLLVVRQPTGRSRQ